MNFKPVPKAVRRLKKLLKCEPPAIITNFLTEGKVIGVFERSGYQGIFVAWPDDPRPIIHFLDTVETKGEVILRDDNSFQRHRP